MKRPVPPLVNLLLLLAIVVLANLVSSNSFFRWDLTQSGAYRLSPVTEETLQRLEDPLRIQVFYTEQVPAPYNGVRQYLFDLLSEFSARDRRRITVEAIDPTTPEGRRQAEEFGLRQVQLQEIRSDQFQTRAVFLGAVVLYGSSVEVIDQIDATSGLEYRLTGAIRRAVTTADALAGITEPVTVTAVISPELSQLQIRGFDTLIPDIEAIFQRMNRDSFDRLRFELIQPLPEEVPAVAERFGMRPVQWQSAAGVPRQGLLEIALTHGEEQRTVPIPVFSELFGGYSLDSPEELEEELRAALRSVVAANPTVGYITGHGERQLWDAQRHGAAPFAQLMEERYQLVEVDISSEDIPAGIDTIIINGPRERYSVEALFRIDQFLMNGGGVLVFLDRYVEEIPTQQEMMMGMQPEWRQIETGLDALLEHYGVTVTGEMVLDTESFIARTPQGGQQHVFQAPLLSGGSFNRTSPVTARLEEMILFNMTEITTPAEGGVATTVLLQTSPESWTVPFPQDIGPWTQGPPPGETLDRRAVAVHGVSGRAGEARERGGDSEAGSGQFQSFFEEPTESLLTERFRPTSVPGAQLMVVSSSELTSPQLLDARQRTPNGIFLLNAVDVLNRAPGFADLRGKGLGVPRIEITSPAVPGLVRTMNMVVAPGAVALLGVLVWLRRRRHSRAIQARFAAVCAGAEPQEEQEA